MQSQVCNDIDAPPSQNRRKRSKDITLVTNHGNKQWLVTLWDRVVNNPLRKPIIAAHEKLQRASDQPILNPSLPRLKSLFQTHRCRAWCFNAQATTLF